MTRTPTKRKAPTKTISTHQHNISQQSLQAPAKRSQHFEAKYRNMVGRDMLHTFGHQVVTCCDMLGVVGSNFQNDQNFQATFVDVAWCCGRLARFVQVHATELRWGMRTSSIFNSQQDATTRGNIWRPNARNVLRPTMLRYVESKFCDRLVGACKNWANNNVGIFYANVLRLPFGRGLAL